jgi:L-threonylcarbamoyladenylate synthase
LVERAVAVLHEGGVVAFPTETVYGLGADAENEKAVRRVFEIKGRPIGHPVIVHLADASQIDLWGRDVPDAAYLLAERFWPGPLTLVLPRTARARDLVTGSQDTVALRAPSHPLAHEILRAFGGGVVAPSANRFGSVSATRAEHVIADLGDAVDLIVDGGPATIGIESTIVDLAHGAPTILRPGGVTREALSEALGAPLREGGSEVRVPGSLPSHYAPRARVELAENDTVADGLATALRAQGLRVSLIGSSEVHAFARDLYENLRAADREGADAIVVVLPQNEGLGIALRDRLRRAASPRG